jgi:hypothetical protein
MKLSRLPSVRKPLAIAICATFLLLAASGFASATPNSPLTVPMTGAVAGGGTFNGTFTLLNFANANNQLVAIGRVAGTVTDAAGAVVGSVVQLVSIPLDPPSASCQILHLVLGPLDLNLLGLTVHLDQVVLDISAVPGAGNLLGNLLCAIANLLNGGGPLNQIVNLLNQILAAIGG